MLMLFQPLLTALVGAVLSVFGLFHTYHLLPGPIVWRHVVEVSPQLLAVVVFGACTLIAVAGLALLGQGISGTRTRLRQLRRLRWPASSPGGSGHADGETMTYDDQRW